MAKSLYPIHLREHLTLPPLTEEEREAFARHFCGECHGEDYWRWRAVNDAPSDAEALAILLRRDDYYGASGPHGWQYEWAGRGHVFAVWKPVLPGTEPNRRGVLIGQPVRAAIFTYAEIVQLVRHGQPAAQLALF